MNRLLFPLAFIGAAVLIVGSARWFAGGGSRERHAGPGLVSPTPSGSVAWEVEEGDVSAGEKEGPHGLGVVHGTIRSETRAAAASPEQEPPEVAGETMVSGKIVDSNGLAVSRAELFVGGTRFLLGAGDSPDQEGLDEGAFALRVEGTGKVEVYARAPGLGRSANQFVDLVAGELSHVGELELLGGLSIEGRVVLPDGTPLIGVALRAEPMEGGQGAAKATSGKGGRFALAGLTAGSFRIRASREADLPVLMGGVLHAGVQGARVELDAVILKISCAGQPGERPGIRRLVCTGVVEDPSTESSVNVVRDAYPALDSFEALIPAGTECLIRASDEARRWRFAHVNGGLTAGVHGVVLQERVPSLASFRLSMPMGESSPDGILFLGKVMRNGVSSQILFPVEASRAAVEVRGLLPGEYEVHVALKASEWRMLDQEVYSFTLHAGESFEGTLEGMTGGRIEVSVDVAPAPLDAKRGITPLVQVRPAQGTEWQRLWLTSEWSDNATSDGASHLLAPGTYVLRAELRGYRPAEVSVQVMDRALTPARLTLTRK